MSDLFGDHFNRGIVFYRSNRLAEAEQSYRAALQINPRSPEALCNLAKVLGGLGRLEAATDCCRRAMKIDPFNAEIPFQLGRLLRRSGDAQGAVPCFRRALSLAPHVAASHYNLGLTLQELGRLQEAAASYREALRLAPADADAHNNLGLVLRDLKNPKEAEAHFSRAIETAPQNAAAHFNLGLVLQELGRIAEADACYRRALQLDSGLFGAHLNLGSLLTGQERFADAEAAFHQALALKPDFAEAHNNLGNVLALQMRFRDAEISYRRAIALQPAYAEAHNNLGNVLGKQGRFRDAEAAYRQALALKPHDAQIHNNLGDACRELGHLDEAAACFHQALAIDPGLVETHANLGIALSELGRPDEAEACYRRALQHDPNYAKAHVALAMLTLPILSNTVAESVSVPRQFGQALTNMAAWMESLNSSRADLRQSIVSQTPFYLAYRDGSHVEILSAYGDLVVEAWERERRVAPHPARKKIRLAMVSDHLRDHSVWHVLTKGILTHLDRQKFELLVYCTGSKEDNETAEAKSLADVWRDVHSVSGHGGWKEAMIADAPDVVLYPELGMDPLALQLAACRLAPLQAASWGHPITSGLPTVDLYFSGELLEAPDADSHYREQLVRLPGTGCCTTPLVAAPKEATELRSKLDSRTDPIFVIPQMPFKFDPAHDALYARIAEAVGKSTFILLRPPKFPWAMDRIYERLSKEFSRRGLSPEEHLLLISWLARDEFLGLLEICDVYLDCPSFSGYTTAWQAVHCGLPIVTMEGRFMRQRLAAGLLRKIGMTESIATTADEYVQAAVALARQSHDRPAYNARRQRLKVAAVKADNDVAVVRALEDSLTEALAGETR